MVFSSVQLHHRSKYWALSALATPKSCSPNESGLPNVKKQLWVPILGQKCSFWPETHFVWIHPTNCLLLWPSEVFSYMWRARFIWWTRFWCGKRAQGSIFGSVMKLNRREDHYSLTFYAPKLCLPLPQTFRSNSAAFSYLRLPCSSGFYEQRLFFQHCTALVISNFAHFRVAFFRSVPLAGHHPTQAAVPRCKPAHSEPAQWAGSPAEA